MNIPKINFPIYMIIILLSIFIGMIYVFNSLKKISKVDNLYLYFILNMMLTLFMGIMVSIILSGSFDFSSIGLSSYGGVVGVILSSLIFEKIIPYDGNLIKFSIISLPLIYGLSKIACFISGCCYGIPYDGLLFVRYNELNVFPVQFLEMIVFIIIFIICNRFKNNKNIIWYTIFTSAFFKFLLDFLRYDHISKLITVNQIISIILMILSIIVLIFKKKIYNEKK